MQTSQLTAHNVFSVTWAAANVCDQSVWKLGAIKKYKNDGLVKTYQS